MLIVFVDLLPPKSSWPYRNLQEGLSLVEALIRVTAHILSNFLHLQFPDSAAPLKYLVVLFCLFLFDFHLQFFVSKVFAYVPTQECAGKACLRSL